LSQSCFGPIPPGLNDCPNMLIQGLKEGSHVNLSIRLIFPIKVGRQR